MSEIIDAPIGVVGFLGVDALGLPLATRLHRAGFALRAVDFSLEQVEQCRSLGIPAGSDPGALAGCDVVIVMVASGDQLLGLVAGEPFTTGGPRGSTLIVMSTVGPEVVRQVEQVANGLGIAVIDCPVISGVAAANQPSLILLASGSRRTLQRVQAVLGRLGTVHHCGEHVGDGQSLKLVNQMLASIHLVAAAEAIGFARALGLNLDTVLDLLPIGAGSSWMLSDGGSGPPRAGSAHLDTFVKDSGLVLDAATAAGFDAPLSAVARAKWLSAAATGPATDDPSTAEIPDRLSLSD